MFFIEFERPLSGKADVQIMVFEKSLRNGRYAHNTVEKLFLMLCELDFRKNMRMRVRSNSFLGIQSFKVTHSRTRSFFEPRVFQQYSHGSGHWEW
jgi:hypothetical protein